MKDVKILGTGFASVARATEDMVKATAAALGTEIALEKVNGLRGNVEIWHSVHAGDRDRR